MHETVDTPSEQDFKARLFNIINAVAVERGDITLASGQKSSIYIDCRQVYFRGEAQYLIGELLYEQVQKIEAQHNTFSACGGMAMGSIPLTCALSAAAFRRGRELPGVAVRKSIKDHGMSAKIEGGKILRPDLRVAVVEDVLTTGSSVIAAVHELRALGCIVDTVFAVVDREQGAREKLAEHGLSMQSLFTLSQFNVV